MSVLKKSKNISKYSDSDLIDAYKKGHEMEWVVELITRYQLNILGVGLKYLKNREDAGDLIIEVFELLTQELLHPTREYTNFKSWLYVITKNLCLMKLRKQKTEDKKQELFLATENMESTTFVHYLDEEDENEVLRKKLAECIQWLKAEQKRCIELFYYKKKTYQEIAMECDYEEKKVKSFIQNGKRNLKICLENNG